ncbi:hypothetical protein [Pseudoramibacter alactolyticus]
MVKKNVKIYICLIISFVVLISSPVIASFIRKNVPKEKQRMLKEGYNYEYDHMKRMIECLQKKSEFEIDVKDERQLDKLIERAEKERNAHNVWRSIELFSFKGIKEICRLIFLGIGFLARNIIHKLLLNWSILKRLSKFIKNGYWQKILSIGIIALYDFLLFYVAVLLVVGFLCDFVIPSKNRLLDSFISDVEDIKLFPDKVCSLINEMKKKAEEKASRQKIIKALKSKFAGNIASKRRKPDGPCVPEYAIKAEKEGAGTLGDPQAAGHKKPSQSAEQK